MEAASLDLEESAGRDAAAAEAVLALSDERGEQRRVDHIAAIEASAADTRNDPVRSAQLELLSSPGRIYRLAGMFSEFDLASSTALAFEESAKKTVGPTRGGSIESRVYFEREERQWRIAVRYDRGAAEGHSGSSG